ncbi:MASE1 domain-containing protein [Actinopolymorpha sp. B17G11]|uniref:MASE1 domain-containing protein n=1 Tax=Actinopolymorpha sp. B17G11 TaxID=3160861 RepID=UPI0032E44827
MVSQRAIRTHLVTVLVMVALAGVYLGTALLGVLQEFGSGTLRTMWPPTGVALAALLLLGPRMWPSVALGSFLVNLIILDHPPLVSAVICLAATLGVVLAVLLLRMAHFQNGLDRLRDLLALVFLGAILGTLVSSAISAGTLYITGALPPETFLTEWFLDWTSTAVSVLVITPFILVVSRLRWPRQLRLRRAAEAFAMLAVAALVTLAAVHSSTELLFLVFPVLIWAAVRFQLAGASAAALITTIVVSHGAVGGFGPFAGGDEFTNLLTIQALDASSALTALALAVTIAERDRAHWAVENAATQLASVVHQLDHRLRPRPLAPQVRAMADQRGAEAGAAGSGEPTSGVADHG